LWLKLEIIFIYEWNFTFIIINKYQYILFIIFRIYLKMDTLNHNSSNALLTTLFAQVSLKAFCHKHLQTNFLLMGIYAFDIYVEIQQQFCLLFLFIIFSLEYFWHLFHWGTYIAVWLGHSSPSIISFHLSFYTMLNYHLLNDLQLYKSWIQ